MLPLNGWPASKRGRPTMTGVMVGRTDTANSDGRGCLGGGGDVRACMRACVMCLQYTIMIFYPC